MGERETLGQNIKKYRLFKGIKGEVFAKKIGLSAEHLSKLENADETAKNIGLNYLIKIAKELNVPIQELFMKNPEEIVVKLRISEDNLNELIKLANLFEDLLDRMQIKKVSK